jgi:hypothetical protein
VLAAAPDMLQALQMALVSIERSVMQQGQDPSTDTEAAIVRAAINKALKG